MEFRILGPVEVYDDEGVQLDLGGPRPRAVLARLLLAGGALVSTDTLIDDLYGGSPPASALASLQSYVSNLRRVIEPGRNPRTPPRLLIGRPPGYLLATRNVDAIRFTELVDGAESCPPGKALASVNKALRLWRGEPYGSFPMNRGPSRTQTDRQALAGLLDEEMPSSSTAAALLDRNQGIARWLAATAQTQPLVIVLDDLHWADPASLELLWDVAVLLAGEAVNVPLTIVSAFRETAFHETAAHGAAFPGGSFHLSLNDVLGQLARYDMLRIRLTCLEADDVRAIASAMGAEVDDAAAERLCERTGGNFFFVRKSARLLGQGREVEAVSESVTVLIRWWLGRLGARAGEVLGVAALIGRNFDPGVVAEVCQASETGWVEVYDALDRAAQAGLIVSGGLPWASPTTWSGRP